MLDYSRGHIPHLKFQSSGNLIKSSDDSGNCGSWLCNCEVLVEGTLFLLLQDKSETTGKRPKSASKRSIISAKRFSSAKKQHKVNE